MCLHGPQLNFALINFFLQARSQLPRQKAGQQGKHAIPTLKFNNLLNLENFIKIKFACSFKKIRVFVLLHLKQVNFCPPFKLLLSLYLVVSSCDGVGSRRKLFVDKAGNTLHFTFVQSDINF